VDNQDEALRVAKSLKCADLIIDPRVTSPDEAEARVDEITAPRHRGHGGCAATIVVPESQNAFTYACKITRKHGTIMTVSVVSSHRTFVLI
jgi:threonine dehydrogenase-like Zn-dependent dehydrogenase